MDIPLKRIEDLKYSPKTGENRSKNRDIRKI